MFLLPFVLGIIIGSFAYESIETWILYALLGYSILCLALSKTPAIRMIIFVIMMFCGGFLRTEIDMKTIGNATDSRSRKEILYHSRMYSAFGISRSTEHIRTASQARYAEIGLEKDNLAIVSAMTLGSRNAITKDLRTLYSKSGAAHTLALSGMHLAVIFGFLYFLLKFIILHLYTSPDFLYKHWKVNRASRWLYHHRPDIVTIGNAIRIAALLLSWCYVIIVGMPMSAVRAVVMLTVYTILKTLNRHAPLQDILFVTVLFILIFQPLALFDVGFEMSFAAVFGIAIISVPLNKHFNRMLREKTKTRIMNLQDVGKKWQVMAWNAGIEVAIWIFACTTLSLAAQIFTTPLTAHYFGIISCYSILSSAFVSVVASIVLCVGMLALAIHTLFSAGIVTSIAAWILNNLISMQNALLEGITSLPGAYVENIDISTLQTFLIYIIIGAAYGIIRIILKK